MCNLVKAFINTTKVHRFIRVSKNVVNNLFSQTRNKPIQILMFAISLKIETLDRIFFNKPLSNS